MSWPSSDHGPDAPLGGPAGPPKDLTVVVYGRPGCHLCEQALVLIERVRAQRWFALEQRDIESSTVLFKRYLERIPVVEIDGVEVFELFVDETKFEQSLEEAQRRHASQ
jgi:Glutaredoxin-like domain (DUF836)